MISRSSWPLINQGSIIMKTKINREVYMGLGLICFSLFFIQQAQSFGEGRRYPTIILGLLGLLSFGLMMQGIYYSVHPEKYKQDTPDITWAAIKKPSIGFVLIAIYTALFKLTGFYISSAIFTPVIMFFYGERSVKNIVLSTLAIEVFVHVVFVQILNVDFAMI